MKPAETEKPYEIFYLFFNKMEINTDKRKKNYFL